MSSVRSRRWIAVLAAGALVAGVGFFLWWRASDQANLDQLADPETVQLPATPEDPGTTQLYLAGPGRPLVDLLTVDPVTTGDGQADAARCRVVVEELRPLGEPGQLHLLAQQIPDAATADMAVSYVAGLIEFLGRCSSGGEADPEDVAFTADVFKRRLDGLGVR